MNSRRKAQHHFPGVGKVVYGGTNAPALRERIAGLEKKGRGNRESIKQLESDVEVLAARLAEVARERDAALGKAAEAVKIDGRVTYWREQFERQLERAEALAAKGDARVEARGTGYAIGEGDLGILRGVHKALGGIGMVPSGARVQELVDVLGGVIGCIKSGQSAPVDELGWSIAEYRKRLLEVHVRAERAEALAATREARADAVGKAMNDLRRAVDDSANWKTDPSPPMRDLVDMREAMRTRAEAAERRIAVLDRQMVLLLSGISECEGDGGCRATKCAKEILCP